MSTTDLNNFDVLCGRGSGPNEKSGNIAFRDLVHRRKQEYLAVNNRDHVNKNRIAKEIVDEVRAKGGRFLKRVVSPDTDAPLSYVLADEPTVMEKTKQALRQNKRSNRYDDIVTSISGAPITGAPLPVHPSSYPLSLSHAGNNQLFQAGPGPPDASSAALWNFHLQQQSLIAQQHQLHQQQQNLLQQRAHTAQSAEALRMIHQEQMRRAQINQILRQQQHDVGSGAGNFSRLSNVQRAAASQQAGSTGLGAGLGGMYEQLVRQQREIEQAQIASASTSHVAMLEQELIQQQIFRDSQIAPVFGSEYSVAPVPASRHSGSSLGSMSAMSEEAQARVFGDHSSHLSPAAGSSLLAKNLSWNNAPGGSLGSVGSLATRAVVQAPSFSCALDDTSFASLGGGGSLGSGSADGKAAPPAEARAKSARPSAGGGMSISETIAEDDTVKSSPPESDAKSVPSDRSDTAKVELLLTAHAMQERKSSGATPPTKVEAAEPEADAVPSQVREPKSALKSHPSPEGARRKKKKKRTSLSSYYRGMKNGSGDRSSTSPEEDGMDVS